MKLTRTNTPLYSPTRTNTTLPTATPTRVCSAEKCNGQDDDCDGLIDEGYAINQVCFKGVGACMVAGITVCDGTGTGVVCNATSNPPQLWENCNGIDDDCDGQVDEGFNIGQPCTMGAYPCIIKGTITCFGCAGEFQQECNCSDGIDDDHDFAIDCADPDCSGRNPCP
jgi:hypothetical protein